MSKKTLGRFSPKSLASGGNPGDGFTHASSDSTFFLFAVRDYRRFSIIKGQNIKNVPSPPSLRPVQPIEGDDYMLF